MDRGKCSSPTPITPGSSAGLLPLFGPSVPPAAEGIEEKLRRVSEENRLLSCALDAILADRHHPHLRNAPATDHQENLVVATAAVVTTTAAEPRPRVRTVRARSEPSDAEANHVKDSYQWRKYGQKVTRDNPYPRAYFRCAYAPSCPVKKKVQRSAEDATMLVAHYEGEHNHAQCAQQNEFAASDASTSHQSTGSLPCSISINSSGRTVTLGLTNQALGSTNETTPPAVIGDLKAPEFRKVLVDEMVDFLKNDPEFMESLTSAVTARMMERVSNRAF